MSNNDLPEDQHAETADDIFASWGHPALPTTLKKACGDHWDYAIGLRSGLVIRFNEATPHENGTWLKLVCNDGDDFGVYASLRDMLEGKLLWQPERGIDVQVADIMWAVDAPFGS